MQQKTSNDVCLLRYGVWQTFCSFTTLLTQKIKLRKKNVKNTCRYYPFTNVYHKRRSYDVWFLRYQVQHTTFYVILDYFLPFYPLIIQKSKFWKNEKLSEILSFYTWVPWIKIIWCMIPEIWSATDRIFSHFEPFFALLSLPP